MATTAIIRRVGLGALTQITALAVLVVVASLGSRATLAVVRLTGHSVEEWGDRSFFVSLGLGAVAGCAVIFFMPRLLNRKRLRTSRASTAPTHADESSSSPT